MLDLTWSSYLMSHWMANARPPALMISSAAVWMVPGNLGCFVVDLCRGQIDESIFDTIWSGTDEAAKAVHSAPPFGLCLERVDY